MKTLMDAAQLKKEIDAYVAHFTGAPLVIGMDEASVYTALLSAMKNDTGKAIVRMSDLCPADWPPNPAYFLSEVNAAARERPVIWLGATQAAMLCGQGELEQFLRNLLGSSLSGPVAVLCPFCAAVLEHIGKHYEKLGYTIVLAPAPERDVPAIRVSADPLAFPPGEAVRGIQGLLYALEEGKRQGIIPVVTACGLSALSASVYPVLGGVTAWQAVCTMDPGIAAHTQESNGSPAQWQRLLQRLQRAGSLSALCETELCPVERLPAHLGDYLDGDEDAAFLCFICLKVFYGDGDDYLAACLAASDSASALEGHIVDAILSYSHEDGRFSTLLRQRRRLLSTLGENSAIMQAFCEKATIKGRDVLWYLSDETEAERAAIIHALSCYAWPAEEVAHILAAVSPRLAAYLRPFTFDEYNTRVMEADAEVRPLLTDYFQRYKLQKLTNRQDEDFVTLVEEEARVRSFMKLQSRSAIVKKLDKEGAQPYFFDALGVEFLAFIQLTAEAAGMQFECHIGHCNLPSITSRNKEFYDAFPAGSILKEEGLDEIKHHGIKYDFRYTTEPLHIFEELALLERDLKKMSAALAQGRCDRVIILSDHGASRLAVTHRSENSMMALSEPGQHSGRCCPAAADPQIPFATYEDGFAVLANYDRFRGSRRADVETHGGASLEETVVPVIVLTLKPKEQVLFFTESVVICSAREGSTIRLFANPPLGQPRMVVGERSYEGQFDGDRHNVVFVMPDLRRKGRHEAVIYDGGVKLTELEFETKRQTGANTLL